MIGTGLKWISTESSKAGDDLAKEIPAQGYAYVHSVDEVKQLDASRDRVDLSAAVEQAVARHQFYVELRPDHFADQHRCRLARAHRGR
jgi:hypothetical protein